MTPRRRSKSVMLVFLAAICAVLAAKVYDEWRRLQQPVTLETAAVAAEDTAASPPLGPGLTVPDEDSFAAIVERPLFSPSRRPGQAAPASAPKTDEASQAKAPPDIVLIGTIVSGNERVALVEITDGSKIVQVRERGEVSGWTALLIEDGRVVFRRGKTEEELVLRYEQAVPPDKIPPPVSAAKPAVQPAGNAQPDSDVQSPVASPEPAEPPG